MKQKLNQKGFTLVELLVVVAIIGILASIVLVSLNSARERTQRASLQSTMVSANLTAAQCVNQGGSVNQPTSATAGGGAICDDATISDAVWPNLSTIQGLENAGFQYGTMSNTNLVATDGTAAVVTCSIENGNCDLN